MSNEISVNLRASVINGDYSNRFDITEAYDQAAQGAVAGIQIVGFAANEAIAAGDLSTEGFLFIKNLDATNYVTFGALDGTSYVPVGKVKAGEFAVFRANPTSTLHWQANTANCKVQYLWLED